MATYTLNAGDRSAHDKALTASTVDTVTFTGQVAEVEIITDGTSKIYVTTDGSAPTVSGANTYLIPASVSVRTIRCINPVSPSVKLISSGTPTYSVSSSKP